MNSFLLLIKTRKGRKKKKKNLFILFISFTSVSSNFLTASSSSFFFLHPSRTECERRVSNRDEEPLTDGQRRVSNGDEEPSVNSQYQRMTPIGTRRKKQARKKEIFIYLFMYYLFIFIYLFIYLFMWPRLNQASIWKAPSYESTCGSTHVETPVLTQLTSR